MITFDSLELIVFGRTQQQHTRKRKEEAKRSKAKMFIKFVTNLLVISLSSLLATSTLSSASERFMRFAVAIELGKSKRLNLFLNPKNNFVKLRFFAKILRTHLNNIEANGLR